MDFETRSACDLKKAGAYVYSLDPSTEIMCLSFKFPEEETPYLWHPAFPSLGIKECELSENDINIAVSELWDRIEKGEEIEAHNSFFEKCIWTNILATKYGWPTIKPSQWRCSASRAAMCSIPRDLDGATQALGLPVDKQKSSAGKKLMLRMCKPKTPVKAERKLLKEEYGPDEASWPVTWYESREMLIDLFDYCRQDTIAEEALSNTLPPLPSFELRLWQIDQQINWHGVYFDREMVINALKIIDRTVDELNAELHKVTKGVLSKGTQRAAIRKYVNDNSTIELPDTKGKTIKRILKDKKVMANVPADVKRVLELCIDINRSSVAKYKSMLPKLPSDNRIRDMLMYHGAGTGRWTGKMVQPHNFPRGSLKPKEAELACNLIRANDKEFIEMVYGPDLSVMEVLSSALRGAITASPGNELVVADYSSIEARVLVWLVNDVKALEVFHSGKDIYKDMAVSIYNVPYDEVNDEQRRMGKQAILGLGYQMGADKFKFTLWDSYDIDISLELAKMVVDAYRIRYAKVKAFWDNINNCAIRAVKNPNRVVKVNDKIMFKCSKGFLRCRLPSGRTLYYRDPRVKKKELPWGGKADTLTYMSVDGKTKKWVRTDTYGGKLTENVTQAIARDFMGYGISNINDHGKYQVILSVHDELLSECPEGEADYEEFEELMAALPPWGAGCPVAAEGYIATRYRK